jgi:transcription antitermination factor NusG
MDSRNKFRIGWCLLYTKPRHEKKVHTRLTELKINAFLPTRKTLRTWHDRRKYIDEPLFPSYVFIYLNDMQNYLEGMDTEGALYYVRTGKEIAHVSDAVVNSLKIATNQGENVEVSDSFYQPGTKLVISQGALTGLTCEVVEHNDKLKLLVRVELLKRNILLTLPEDHLMLL